MNSILNKVRAFKLDSISTIGGVHFSVPHLQIGKNIGDINLNVPPVLYFFGVDFYVLTSCKYQITGRTFHLLMIKNCADNLSFIAHFVGR